MKLSLIAAMAKNRVIGANNRLPWHLPADLRNFRRVTMGKPIMMGRKTFDSIGRPLPGRTNVVISRNRNYRPEGCVIFHSIDAALQQFRRYEEVMVIGGASFYEQLLPVADRLYLTVIDRDFAGDTVFPRFDASRWQQIERQDFPADSETVGYRFLILEKSDRSLPKPQPQGALN